jgi:hypothetical protein
MNKKIPITAGALLAPFALAVIGLSLSSPSPQTPAISPSQVFTRDCEIPVQKPDAITFTCADGNMFVEEIDWSRWSSKSATGIGKYTTNTCDPSCAEGDFISNPVNITLSNLTEFKKKYYFRTLVIESKDGKNLPKMQSSSYEWDVMEFVEMMGWDE